MLQLLYDPLQIIPLRGMHVLALAHDVAGQLGHIGRGLEVFSELDPFPLPLLSPTRNDRPNVVWRRESPDHSGSRIDTGVIYRPLRI